MSLPVGAQSAVLPVATLGELLAYGFEMHVWCPRCHQFRRAVMPDEWLRSGLTARRAQ